MTMKRMIVIRLLVIQSIDWNEVRGRARTQVPTTRNYTLELPTFGVIAGVNPVEVQWKGLILRGPPSWSRCLSRQVSMTFNCAPLPFMCENDQWRLWYRHASIFVDFAGEYNPGDTFALLHVRLLARLLIVLQNHKQNTNVCMLEHPRMGILLCNNWWWQLIAMWYYKIKCRQQMCYVLISS